MLLNSLRGWPQSWRGCGVRWRSPHRHRGRCVRRGRLRVCVVLVPWLLPRVLLRCHRCCGHSITPNARVLRRSQTSRGMPGRGKLPREAQSPTLHKHTSLATYRHDNQQKRQVHHSYIQHPPLVPRKLHATCTRREPASTHTRTQAHNAWAYHGVHRDQVL